MKTQRALSLKSTFDFFRGREKTADGGFIFDGKTAAIRLMCAAFIPLLPAAIYCADHGYTLSNWVNKAAKNTVMAQENAATTNQTLTAELIAASTISPPTSAP